MNAISRTVVSSNPFGHGTSISFNLLEYRVFLMIFLLLISALGLVYVKDLNRRLFITQHKLQAQIEQLQSESNKLLLEQGAWTAQARVQKIAQQQLHMQIPLSADVVVIKA